MGITKELRGGVAMATVSFWEYLSIDLPPNKDLLDVRLSELGRQGWELVFLDMGASSKDSTPPYKTPCFFCVMKRKKFIAQCGRKKKMHERADESEMESL